MSIFIENKYTKCYFNIISKAQQQFRKKNLGIYFENHHIIPKSLGGTNGYDNMILLTPREHFICHRLLIKMTSGQDRFKMIFASNMLSNIKNIGKGRYVPSSRTYDIIRNEFIEAMANYWTEEKRKSHGTIIGKIVKGRKHSEKTKEKLRNKVWTQKAIDSRINNCLTSAANRKGKKWSDNRRNAYKTWHHSEQRNKKFSLRYKGVRFSKGNCHGFWFSNPEGIEILFYPFNSAAKNYGLSLYRLKKLIHNSEYFYDGWTFLRKASMEELKNIKLF